MLIDVHNHLGLSVDTTEGSCEGLLEAMELAGVDISLIFPIDEADKGETYHKQNDDTLEMVSRYPDRFVGICRLRPQVGDAALQELQRVQGAGLRGIKIHPKTDQVNPEDCHAIFEAAGQNAFPVLIHTDHHESAKPILWEPLFKKYSKVPFIMTHGGKDDWPEAGRVAKELSNVYMDTSTLSWNRTRMLLRLAGPEKIVFGSDYPYSHPLIERKKFELLLDDAESLAKIFYENAKKIFKLD